MYTFPNQYTIKIHKKSYNRDFLQIGIDEWQEASKVLTPSAFKIYLYLASNADGYNMALSKQDIKDKLGISFSRYYEAISLMRKLHYICSDGSNNLQFFLTPNPEFEKSHEIKNWESEQYEPKSENDDLKTVKSDPKTSIEINNIDNYRYKDNYESFAANAANRTATYSGSAAAKRGKWEEQAYDLGFYRRIYDGKL